MANLYKFNATDFVGNNDEKTNAFFNDFDSNINREDVERVAIANHVSTWDVINANAERINARPRYDYSKGFDYNALNAAKYGEDFGEAYLKNLTDDQLRQTATDLKLDADFFKARDALINKILSKTKDKRELYAAATAANPNAAQRDILAGERTGFQQVVDFFNGFDKDDEQLTRETIIAKATLPAAVRDQLTDFIAQANNYGTRIFSDNRETQKGREDLAKFGEKLGLNVAFDEHGKAYVRNANASGRAYIAIGDTSFGDEFMAINDEIGAAITGALAGAKIGAAAGSVVPIIGTALGAVGGSILGGGVGAYIGANKDATEYVSQTHRDLESERESIQSKALDAGISDAVFGAGLEAGAFIARPAVRAIKRGLGFGEPVTPAPSLADRAREAATEVAERYNLKEFVADNSLIGAFINNARNGNRAAVKDISSKIIDSESLNAAADASARSVKLNTAADAAETNSFFNKIGAKFKSLTDSADKAELDEFSLNAFLRDKTGSAANTFEQIASSDQLVTTQMQKLTNDINGVINSYYKDISRHEIGDLMNDAIATTKAEFNETLQTLQNSGAFRAVKLSEQWLDDFAALEGELLTAARGSGQANNIRALFNDIANEVANGDIDVVLLNNLRSLINSRYTDAPSFKQYFTSKGESELLNLINRAFDEIFATNPAATSAGRELYDIARSQYAQMKRLASIQDAGYIYGSRATQNEADHAIARLLDSKPLKDGQTNDITRLLDNLKPNQRAAAETNIIDYLVFRNADITDDGRQFINIKGLQTDIENLQTKMTFKSREAADILAQTREFYDNFAGVYGLTRAANGGIKLRKSASGISTQSPFTGMKISFINNMKNFLYGIAPSNSIIAKISKLDEVIASEALRSTLRSGLKRGWKLNFTPTHTPATITPNAASELTEKLAAFRAAKWDSPTPPTTPPSSPAPTTPPTSPNPTAPRTPDPTPTAPRPSEPTPPTPTAPAQTASAHAAPSAAAHTPASATPAPQQAEAPTPTPAPATPTPAPRPPRESAAARIRRETDEDIASQTARAQAFRERLATALKNKEITRKEYDAQLASVRSDDAIFAARRTAMLNKLNELARTQRIARETAQIEKEHAAALAAAPQTIARANAALQAHATQPAATNLRELYAIDGELARLERAGGADGADLTTLRDNIQRAIYESKQLTRAHDNLAQTAAPAAANAKVAALRDFMTNARERVDFIGSYGDPAMMKQLFETELYPQATGAFHRNFLARLEKQAGELYGNAKPATREVTTAPISKTRKTKAERELERRQQKVRQIVRQLTATEVSALNYYAGQRTFVGVLDEAVARQLGFADPRYIVQSIDHDAIRHTLNRHGEGGEMAKNGQLAVTRQDIADYPKIVSSADEQLLGTTGKGLTSRVSFKQINGYHVVVEEVHNGQGELAFKTMFKENGDYHNNKAYKDGIAASRVMRGTTPRASYLGNTERNLPNSNLKSAETAAAPAKATPPTPAASQPDLPAYATDFDPKKQPNFADFMAKRAALEADGVKVNFDDLPATKNDNFAIADDHSVNIRKVTGKPKPSPYADGEIKVITNNHEYKTGRLEKHYDPLTGAAVPDPIFTPKTKELNYKEAVLSFLNSDTPRAKAAKMMIKHGINERFYSPYQREIADEVKRGFSLNKVAAPNSNLREAIAKVAPAIKARAAAHIGTGLASGTAAGFERDENGNFTGIDPAKFVAGFIAGAAGTAAAKAALKSPATRAAAENFIKRSGENIREALLNSNLDAAARRAVEMALGKKLTKMLDTRQFIIAGENAIGAPRDKLAAAKQMQTRGAGGGEIWLETGWYFDKDGKWKFEINPAGGAWKWHTEPTGETSGKLGEFLSDDELFAAYPQLKNYSVEFKDLGELLGAFHPSTKTLEIALTYEDVMKSTLYHELQHAVQYIENFARGGNPQTARAALKRPENAHLAGDLAAKYNDKKSLGREAYERLHGEVEARNVAERMGKWDEINFGFDEDGETLKFVQSHPHATQDVNLADTIIVQDKRKLREAVAKVAHAPDEKQTATLKSALAARKN